MKYVQTLHSQFEEAFMDAYREANPRKKRKILPYLHAIHRRWYYATLVEHTPFSPANLMEVICIHHGEDSGKYPLPVLRTPTKVMGIDSQIITYTADDHPIIGDMRSMLDFCTPHIDLCEEVCFSDEQATKAAELLSINDPHYASFMLELVMWLKLLVKMPSLYVQRMQLSKKCKELMSGTNREILDIIINATISMTSAGLKHSIPTPEHIFTESFLRSLLTKPMETDDIFARVFEIMGYEMEDLLEISNMPTVEGIPLESMGFDMELLSGTFVMGIVLDRYFFTPFGHFLRLIRPMYALPFALDEEIADYIDVCEDPQEAFVAFFAPCSSYTLTDLGLEILDVTPNEDNYFVASEMPFDSMKETIFADEEAFSTFIEMARHLSPLALTGGFVQTANIFTFRIRLELEPTVWMHLQVSKNMNLHHIYDEVIRFFDIKPNGDYSFFHDKTENRFAEYPSAKRANRAKNPRKTSCQTPLADLDLVRMKHLILVAHNQAKPFAGEASIVRLQLEMLNEKPPDPEEFYPRCSRMSKELKSRTNADFEDELDFPF